MEHALPQGVGQRRVRDDKNARFHLVGKVPVTPWCTVCYPSRELVLGPIMTLCQSFLNLNPAATPKLPQTPGPVWVKLAGQAYA